MAADEIRLGTIDRGGVLLPLSLPVAAALDGHLIATGQTRSGKSAAVEALLYQALTRTDTHTIVLDMKSEVSRRVTRSGAAVGEHDGFLSPADVRVIAPFENLGAGMNPLLMPGVPPNLIATLVSMLFASLPGSSVGIRMEGVVRGAVRATAPLRGSLLDCRRVLVDEAFREAVAAATPDPEAREYLTTVLPTEPAASVSAVRSRIDALLDTHAGLRRMLLADHCIAGDDLMASRLTIINAGGPPLGLRVLSEFVAGLAMLLLSQAIYRRAEGPRSPRVILWIDEVHEAARVLHDDVERLLALAAFAGVYVYMTCQTLEQLRDFSPRLVASLHTNVNTHLLFAPTAQDLAFIERLLPMTGKRVDRQLPDRVLREAEERDELRRTLASLPPRHCLYVNRRAGIVEMLRTPAIPYGRIDEAFDRLPRWRQQEWLRGGHARDLDTLTQAEIEVGEPVAAPEGVIPIVTPVRRPRRAGKVELP